jgi:hypothetical protein
MKIISLLITSLAIIILAINVSSAATVDITSGKLPPQLREGDQANLTINIKDYSDAKQLTLETSLVQSGDKPLWDFGQLNPNINANRYQQKILLNLSSLPATITVSISGQAPSGETKTQYDTGIFVTKFSDTKLKLYEADVDGKLVSIESSDFIISKKENFENTMSQITDSKYDNIKKDIRNLFDLGLVTDAQTIADDLNKIKDIPSGNLLLFGLIKIGDALWLNIAAFVLIIIGIIIGFLLNSRSGEEEET